MRQRYKKRFSFETIASGTFATTCFLSIKKVQCSKKEGQYD